MKSIRENKEIQRVLFPADADAFEQHEEAIKQNKERLNPDNYDGFVKDFIKLTGSDDSRYSNFNVSSREDLAKLINVAKKLDMPYKVERPINENYKYSLRVYKKPLSEGKKKVGSGEFLNTDAGMPDVNTAFFNSATNVGGALGEGIISVESKDRNLIIKTDIEATDKNLEIFESLIGQLSDGMWEGSRRAEKYWKGLKFKNDGGFVSIICDKSVVVYDGSKLSNMDDYEVSVWIINWIANKLKEIVKRNLEDYKEKGKWDRNNTSVLDYIGYNEEITVRDVYKVYDELKDRVERIVDSLKRNKDSIKESMALKNKLKLENLKVFTSSLEGFIPSIKGKDTWDLIIKNNKLEEFSDLLEKTYPDGIEDIKVDKILYNEREWVLDELGIEDNGEVVEPEIEREEIKDIDFDKIEDEEETPNFEDEFEEEKIEKDEITESLNKEDGNINVKEWYLDMFPDDELGEEIKDNLTFNDINNALYSGKDIYDVLGVADSIIRERCFAELSNLEGVDYDVIYYRWLDNAVDESFVENKNEIYEDIEDEEETPFDFNTEYENCEVIDDLDNDVECEDNCLQDFSAYNDFDDEIVYGDIEGEQLFPNKDNSVATATITTETQPENKLEQIKKLLTDNNISIEELSNYMGCGENVACDTEKCIDTKCEPEDVIEITDVKCTPEDITVYNEEGSPIPTQITRTPDGALITATMPNTTVAVGVETSNNILTDDCEDGELDAIKSLGSSYITNCFKPIDFENMGEDEIAQLLSVPEMSTPMTTDGQIQVPQTLLGNNIGEEQVSYDVDEASIDELMGFPTLDENKEENK